MRRYCKAPFKNQLPVKLDNDSSRNDFNYYKLSIVFTNPCSVRQSLAKGIKGIKHLVMDLF